MQASINLDQSQMIDLESAIVSEGSAVVLSELHSLTTTEDGTCEQYTSVTQPEV
ncbi:hypothetical protein JCM19232_4226 [Vibrio ishigakensis]|uniref:Uncharacterized protein n=1 Tax=Vibrio ishigakensis TaxID=1481914 RepID=A0A0B8PG06_9VIBR|nr:hypothetical protein JCM19232_4226 [Vibrio ishigakensis]